jgi:hypothetical protein
LPTGCWLALHAASGNVVGRSTRSLDVPSDFPVKEIALVLLGFVLAWAPQWLDRRRKLNAHWAALRAEATRCVELANILRTDGVSAPLYRLPTMAYEKSFPILLADGDVSEAELGSLSGFFSEAQNLNRGLDNAAAMAHVGDAEKLDREYRRNLLKATALAQGEDGKDALSKSAYAIINQKLERGRWEQ